MLQLNSESNLWRAPDIRYADDLIGRFFFMQDQPERFILYNYCYPKPYTIKDICDAFVKVAGLQPPLGTVPLSLMINAAKVFRFFDSIGLKNGINPARMYKLIRSTYVVPGELMNRGYPYQTDLEEGLRRWLMDDPKGDFV